VNNFKDFDHVSSQSSVFKMRPDHIYAS